MTAVGEGQRSAAPAAGADGLVAWAEKSGHNRPGGLEQGGLRFVFYGRVSMEDWQDPVTSRARQRGQAEALVRGCGVIVAEFFDAGQSRTVAWGRRPEAAALIALLADPGRGWDAIVIGEYERAFYGSQNAAMAPLFEHYGVLLVDAGGGWPGRLRVRARRARHDRPRTVIKTGSHPDEHPGADRDGGPGPGAGPVPRRPPAVRVPAGRCRAAPEQSARRLGPPRPPSGARSRDGAFRAVDLRPAARRPFCGTDRAGAQRGGRALPSASDPGRNPHRTGAGWTLGTVTTILRNPRYTGRQVWNRQRTDRNLVDPGDIALGHRPVQRWNLPDGWVISRKPAHPALVSEAGFMAAQDIRAARGPSPRGDLAGPGNDVTCWPGC